MALTKEVELYEALTKEVEPYKALAKGVKLYKGPTKKSSPAEPPHERNKNINKDKDNELHAKVKPPLPAATPTVPLLPKPTRMTAMPPDQPDEHPSPPLQL